MWPTNYLVQVVLVSLVALSSAEGKEECVKLGKIGLRFESPNYPKYEPPWKVAKVIVMTEGSGFKVNCTASILKRIGCSRGTLRLRTVPTNLQSIVNLCNEVPPSTWEFIGKNLSIWFKTTYYGKGRFSCIIFPLENIETTSPTEDLVVRGPNQVAKPTSCPCGWPKNRPGAETEVEYVFMAEIKIKTDEDDAFCGGSIVSQRHVLTAAHCVFGKKSSKIEVAVGGHKIYTGSKKEKPNTLGVQKIYIHKDFSKEDRTNDIALLVLSKEIEITPSVGPVCLPIENYTLIDQQLTALGWGWGSAKSTTLHSVDLQVIDLAICADGKYPISLDKPTQLCILADPEDKRIKFDGVGPLVYLDPGMDRYVQVGLRSYTDGNRFVHTHIFPFFDWIQSIIELPVKRSRWSALVERLTPSSGEGEEGNSMQYKTCEKLNVPAETINYLKALHNL